MKAVIFDIDGTIVDIPKKSIIGLYNKISKKLNKKQPSEEAIFLHWYGFNETKILQELNIDESILWDLFRKEDNPEFRKKHALPFKDNTILDFIVSQKIKIGYNTDAPLSIAEKQLKKIKSPKGIIIANHNGIPRKPDPNGLLQIIKELEVKKEDVLFVGNTPQDIIAGLRAEVQTALIDREDYYKQLAVTPDYILKSLKDISKIPFNYYKELIKNISVDNIDQAKQLSKKELENLKVHFKRIRHHSLVTGNLCSLVSKELNLDPSFAFKLGLFHDIDYASTFFDFENHGKATTRFLNDPELLRYIGEHSYNPKSLPGKFLFAIEGWLKRFVHCSRKNNSYKPAEVTYSESLQIYNNSDPKKNEVLTKYNSPSLFSDFLKWQNECNKKLKEINIGPQKLYNSVMKAFAKYNSQISNCSVDKERRIIYGRN